MLTCFYTERLQMKNLTNRYSHLLSVSVALETLLKIMGNVFLGQTSYWMSSRSD